MLNDFANEIEEIVHLAGGSNATLEQVRQDLTVIVERMRAAQQPLALDAAKSWRCGCGFDMAIDAVKCIACGSPRK